jgi:hypothetical protein
MSLTIFVHSKKGRVALVEWFRDSRGYGDFAFGPVQLVSLGEFRDGGHERVLRHFTDYQRRRVPQAEFRPVFEPRQARKVMDGGRALMVFEHTAGILEFAPMSIKKYSITDLERHADSVTFDLSGSAQAFWDAFDEALRRAEPDEPAL